MATRARERLLETAEDLFYAEGIRAVGIDRILAESGVGKASLYRHFGSKDDLVAEVLRGRDVRWRQWLAETVAAYDLPAEEQVAAVFDALAERFARDDFRGCAFINTMIEAADRTTVAHQVAAEHKSRLTDYVEQLLASAGRPGRRDLAEQLTLLVDGAIVTAVREGSPRAALQAKAIAHALLRQTQPPEPGSPQWT